MKPRLAFDLDETLGVPIVDGRSITGFNIRQGALELLERLAPNYSLLLWSFAERRYVDQLLSFGLKKYFPEVYSWDEIPCEWKDLRKIRADYLVDDIPSHREQALAHGLRRGYIVVPPYGSPEDLRDPLLWVRQVEEALAEDGAN